jgi:hypothetical protein
MREARGDRRPFVVRHMWPATRVEAAAPPTPKGPASPRSSVPPPLRKASYPPAAPTTPPPPAAPAQKQEGRRILSPRPASADYFLKVPTGGKSLWDWDLISSMCFTPNRIGWIH